MLKNPFCDLVYDNIGCPMQSPMNVTSVAPFLTHFEGNTTAGYVDKYSVPNVAAITFLEKFSKFRDSKEFAISVMGLWTKICFLMVDFLEKI